MKIQKFNIRGTEINKVSFYDIESFLEEKGIDTNNAFDILSDENEMIYVSNGFISGLKNENTVGEWHHFFKKDTDGNFSAGKFKFN